MRLIDADSLKELYEEFGEYEDNLVIPIKVVLQNIDDMLTAYDLDGVLERLEEEKNPMYRKDGTLMAKRTGMNIDKAVEIVKGGAE